MSELDMTAHEVTPERIAAELARVRGEAPRPPTPEQSAVIAAPLAPALVVAGAGSGKTETMANRVLWLLANRVVESPSQILGLTFTRKAAGELGTRIRERIAELESAGLMPEHDPLDQPEIATYNSFANGIYREHAILLGRDGDAPVLGEAAAWQLARSVVIRSSDPRLPELGKNLETVTRAVLAIARGLAENARSPEEVRDLARRYAALADLPPGSARGAYEGAVELARSIGSLDVLTDLAVEFDAEKVRRGVVEYADQVVLALRIAEMPGSRVGADLRRQFRVVLLDEYQDTSVVQTRLLAALFAGHPVMAVGDPNQSIYGWRGASAANLPQFAELFGAGERWFELSTSWRNGRRILDAANHLVEPFRADRRMRVATLAPAPGASDEPVEAVFEERLEDEAAAVAEWLGARIATPRPDGRPSTAALLLRTRRTQHEFLDALRARGIPFHVLGIGGLLAEPEIADLVATLTVLHDPEAGLELIRVLAGSRWRIGPSDLHALSRVASWLRDRDPAQQLLGEDVRRAMRASVAPGEGGSIVDALDFVATAPDGHVALERFSEEGLARLRDAGLTLRRLRERAGLDLPDFVALVVSELQLDIEVAANEFRVMGSANLDAFSDALQGYLAIAEVATLGGFLAWLREAELREDLSPRPEDPEPGTVQVLTVHGAKGLEWDAVAVPRMVADELPAKPLEGYGGWLGFGQYPWPLRGDADELPSFEGLTATTRKELVDRRDEFKERVRLRAIDEERRLAYVAVTRARHRLLLSGSFWATQTKPREPGIFLRELAGARIIDPLPEGPRSEQNPHDGDPERFRWPLDPLGSRRPLVEQGAAAVRAAEPAITGRWARELELLLAERAERERAQGAVPLPTRVPASRFKDFVTEPGEIAAGLLRPMPERPFRATRLGTLFHSWVEQRYGLPGGSDELDAGMLELDSTGDPVDDAQLERLRATFEASPWASRRPLEVEREIHLPFDDRIVVCKIDAIYADGEGEDRRYQVVDWKTGKAPKDAEDLERKQLQLALYRLAYAKWAGVPIDRISAAFYFVADDAVIEPEHIDSEEELLARWRAAFPADTVTA